MARYDSFLLRIWRSTRQGDSQVAFRLEHCQSGEKLHCRDLQTLYAYLGGFLAEDAAAPAPEPLDAPHGEDVTS